MNVNNLRDLPKGCWWLSIIPFGIVGIGIIGFIFYHGYNGYCAKNWTRVIATVEKVKFLESDNDKGATTYGVDLLYSYRFNGKDFSDDNLSFGYMRSNFELHDKIFVKLRKAKKLEIYVNPNAPSQSVVLPGWNNTLTYLLIFAILWNAMVINIALVWILKKSDPKKSTLLLVLLWAIGFYFFLTKPLSVDHADEIVITEYRNGHSPSNPK